MSGRMNFKAVSPWYIYLSHLPLQNKAEFVYKKFYEEYHLLGLNSHGNKVSN